jgi:hypothetical protein
LDDNEKADILMEATEQYLRIRSLNIWVRKRI